MQEDYQDTIVLNKEESEALEAEVAEAQAKAQEEAEAEAETETETEAEAETEIEGEAETEGEAEAETKEDSIPEDIEYTLLVHEVPDLTVVLPKPEPAAAVLERAVGPGEDDETPEEADTEAEAEEEADEGEVPEEGKTETGYGLPEGHVEIGELNKRIAARRRYNERKKRRFRARFYIIATVLIMGAFFAVLSVSSIFTVDSIEVRGNKHYTAEEIINMGHAVPGRNLFYGLNKKETEEYLKQNPYIKSARVSRKLPSTMVIKVTERKEKMAFRYDDDYLVMDGEGILLKKTRNVPKTTLIEGIVINKIKLGEKVGAENGDRLDKALELIKATSDADLYFVKIDMEKESKIKAYIYETLAVKTDYNTLMTNLENGRLHLVVEKLFSEGIERGTITFEEDGSASFMPAI